jgi:hypothetical protein
MKEKSLKGITNFQPRPMTVFSSMSVPPYEHIFVICSNFFTQGTHPYRNVSRFTFCDIVLQHFWYIIQTSIPENIKEIKLKRKKKEEEGRNS